MKILLIDATHAFLDFALRCLSEGHEVRLFQGPNKDGTRSEVGDGLVEKVKDWQSSMKWADLILLADNCKYMRELEGYRKRGFPIFGPNEEVANWELDRELGQQVLANCGIVTIPSHQCKTYDDAIHLVKSSMRRYVAKPSGDAPKALSYVSKGPQDMIFMLEHWKKCQQKHSLLLQEFIPGIEMAVGGWFGRGGFSKYFMENFEFKKLMNDDVGCNTGEMGTALRYVTADCSKLAREMLLPLEGELYRQGYTGYIDVAVIIDKKGHPWPLEFTSRPGWPLFNIQQILHKEPVEWMLDLVKGTDSFVPYEETAVGVVVAIPDFPYSSATKKEVTGFPVWGITEKNSHYVHPSEMKAGKALTEVNGKLKEQPVFVTAGEYVLVASGCKETVSDAAADAYKLIKELQIPNSPMYRTDIGCRLEKQLPLLQEHGYAEDWTY
jgi:phosphoribosylamine--glycine ligase